MAVTSDYSIILNQTGDVEYQQTFAGTTNATGSGQNQLVDLSSGNNTITVPSNAVGVTIVPPADNTDVLTLKGVNGDTGIIISPADPMFLSLDGASSFVINASGAVTGVRLIYS